MARRKMFRVFLPSNQIVNLQMLILQSICESVESEADPLN